MMQCIFLLVAVASLPLLEFSEAWAGPYKLARITEISGKKSEWVFQDLPIKVNKK